MELETRAPVRAHQGLRKEERTLVRAREGDRRAHGEQAALRQGRDEVLVRVTLVGVLVTVEQLAVSLALRLVFSLVLVEQVVWHAQDDGSVVGLTQDHRAEDDDAEVAGEADDDRAEDDRA